MGNSLVLIMLFLQLLRESVLFAINSLRVNKLRTFLSLLGISIGIFTIITVFTFTDSFERNLRSSVEKLGSNVIYIQKWPWIFGGDYPWWKYFNRPNPSYKDYEELEKRINGAEAITFEIGISNKTIKYKSNSVEDVYIGAVSQHYDKVRALEFTSGRYLTLNEFKSGRNYAFIGSAVAEGLFGNIDPIGKDIKLMGRKVTVIGVLKKEGEDMFDNSTDECVFIPINYARNLVDTRSDRYNPMMTVKAKADVPLEELKNELTVSLRAIHRLSPREDDDFALNQSSMLSSPMEALFGFINAVGWVIGLFSIIVGGFGIANIMFVSVKERTNIIGIQKSLGAKNYFILLQFLFEAIILCLIGGLLGLSMVYIITLLAKLANINIVLTFGNMALGLIVSAVIGVVSGIIPAYSASNMDPVEAIRAK